jgi:toxin-antitoxin system PIN domain toxin
LFVVDTNVFVYAADEDSPYHDPCRRSVERWRGQISAWFTTWGILFEFLRVITHPRVLQSPWDVVSAWTFVEAVLASPGIEVLTATERHGSVVTQVFSELPHLRGNVMHDARTAILMREHGIKTIYTRDTDFHRFPFLEPADPVAELV